MARGAEIDGFGEKLRLAMGRANLSRARLAQLVGLDKTVVTRWLSGVMRPGDQSLATLSAALGREIAGFSRADWDLPMAAFAARLGLAPVAVAQDPAVAETLARYGGLWVFCYPAVATGAPIYHVIVEIGAGADGGAEMVAGVAGAVHVEGRVDAWDAFVSCTLNLLHPVQGIVFAMLTGVLPGQRAVVLDGLVTTRGLSALGAVVGFRWIGFRVADALEDAAARLRRRERMWARAAEPVVGTPEVLIRALTMEGSAETGGAVLRVPLHRSWTCARSGLRPGAGTEAQAEVLAWVLAHYADALNDA